MPETMRIPLSEEPTRISKEIEEDTRDLRIPPEVSGVRRKKSERNPPAPDMSEAPAFAYRSKHESLPVSADAPPDFSDAQTPEAVRRAEEFIRRKLREGIQATPSKKENDEAAIIAEERTVIQQHPRTIEDTQVSPQDSIDLPGHVAFTESINSLMRKIIGKK